MKLDEHIPARKFAPYPGIELADCGDLWLDTDEQVTVRTPTGEGSDIARKEWGFYLCNSLNHTLREQGLKTALVGSGTEHPRLYILLVETRHLALFRSYLDQYSMRLICWLDEWLERSPETR